MQIQGFGWIGVNIWQYSIFYLTFIILTFKIMSKIEEIFQRIREMLMYWREARYSGDVIIKLHIKLEGGGVRRVKVTHESDL